MATLKKQNKKNNQQTILPIFARPYHYALTVLHAAEKIWERALLFQLLGAKLRAKHICSLNKYF